jgi:hypothetical protein
MLAASAPRRCTKAIEHPQNGRWRENESLREIRGGVGGRRRVGEEGLI